jgi:hypothetical protein
MAALYIFIRIINRGIFMNKLIIALSAIFITLSSFIFKYSLDAQSKGCKIDITTDQYTRDDDFDGYPDFVETGAGYRSDSDDCLDKMKCGKLGDLSKIGEKKNILLVLDASGSMSAKMPSGKSRMETAKESIVAYINILPADTSVGLVVYSAKGFRGDSCSQIMVVSEIQKLNKKKLSEQINSVFEAGQTPLAASVKFSAGIFEKYPDDDNHIIVISDGEESCGGNPIQEVYNIRGGKGKPMVDVIGLCVRGAALQQLKCMAEVSFGKFHSVETAQALEKVLKNTFLSSRDFYKTLVCLQKDFNSYKICEKTKFTKSEQWMLKKEVMVDDEMKSKIKAAREQITKKYDQIQKLTVDMLQKKAAKLEKDTK